MQTRHRTAQQRNALPITVEPDHRRGASNTRSTGAPLVDGLGNSTAAQQAMADAGKKGVQPGSIAEDPAPRRGARVEKAFSVTNITTRGEDDDRGEEDDDGDGGASETSVIHVSTAQEDQDESQQVMKRLLPDLERATTEMAELLQADEQESKNNIFRAVLKTKRDAFMYIRDYYRQPNAASMLVDWIQPGALNSLSQSDKSVVNILARVNVVTTLDYVRRMQTVSAIDQLALLQALDTGFPALFQTPDLVRAYPMLRLNIRTCYLIETLANMRSKTKTNAEAAVARVFCDTANRLDYRTLCEKGHYRSLGGDEEEDKMRCDNVVKAIRQCVAAAKSNLGLETLRRSFSLRDLLNDVDKWTTEMYKALVQEVQGVQEEPSENAPNGQFDSDGSEFSSESEHQEIVRFQEGCNEPTLFQGRESLIELEASAKRVGADESRDKGPRLPTEGRRSVVNAAGPSGGATKRPSDDAPAGRGSVDQNDIYEFESEPEKDRRDVQSPTVTAWAKRHRVYPDTQAPKAPPSSTAASDVRQRRRQEPADRRGRDPWLPEDVEALIKLVGEVASDHSGNWAVMEQDYRDRFQKPRNQQAYKDKARSLKVKYLKEDKVLPRNFNVVSIAKKEKDAIQKCRKNPDRREQDVDEFGRPTNTEYPG